MRTTGRAGGGGGGAEKERSGLNGGTGRVLWEDSSGEVEHPVDGVQERGKTEGMRRKEMFRLRSGLERVERKWRGNGREGGRGTGSGGMRAALRKEKGATRPAEMRAQPWTIQ